MIRRRPIPRSPNSRTEAELFLRKNGFRPSRMRGYDFSHRFHVNGWRRSIDLRDDFLSRFGFAVLTTKTIRAIQPYCPLLEVGCGSGYWSYEFRRFGLDVIATDPGTGKYRFTVEAEAWEQPWLEIERLSGVEAVTKYPSRNLLMVWPDMDKWPTETLRRFSGTHMLYVGEGNGGCTGDDKFHDLLATEFDEKTQISIPQFDGIHDDLYIYERKKP